MKEIKYNSSKKTHERIKKAFAELIAEKKAMNKITVADLAEKAEITRGTFYSHFNNIYEVAEEIEEEFMSSINSSHEEIKTVEDFPIFLHKFFEFLTKNEELYRQILSSDAPTVFVNRLNVQIGEAARRAIRKYPNANPVQELDVAFFIDGATYMILKYFRGEISLSLDEIEWYLKERAFATFFNEHTPKES